MKCDCGCRGKIKKIRGKITEVNDIFAVVREKYSGCLWFRPIEDLTICQRVVWLLGRLRQKWGAFKTR